MTSQVWPLWPNAINEQNRRLKKQLEEARTFDCRNDAPHSNRSKMAIGIPSRRVTIYDESIIKDGDN